MSEETKAEKPVKYRWDYGFSWAVEFVRKDAEIALSIEGQRANYVIGRSFPSRDAAQDAAVEFCEKLDKEVREFIQSKIAGLKRAKE